MQSKELLDALDDLEESPRMARQAARDKIIKDYDTLKQSHDKLVEYAQHLPMCELHKTLFQLGMEEIKNPKCTCGFEQALKEAGEL